MNLFHLSHCNHVGENSNDPSGLAFVAGAPDESLIVTKMSEEHPGVLAGADLQKLVDWIAAGAEDN